jgi:DNA polymerase III subunit beta
VAVKITCSQSVLNQNLSLVNRVVPARPPQPILKNILLEADAESGSVTLTGFDLDLGIETRFPAVIDRSGRIALPSRLLGDIISRLPNEELTIDVGADESISLECGSSSYQIQGTNADEFPHLPEIAPEHSHILPVSELLGGIQRTVFAASGDENKLILNGVSIRTLSGGMEFVATDGHRLCFLRTDTTGEQKLEAVVPTRSLRELEKMLASQSTEEVEVNFDDKQMVFQFPNQCLTTRLLNGRYPDYHQLLPKEFVNVADIDRKQFISSLERIAVLADQKNHIIRLDLDAKLSTAVISVEASDVGRGKESLGIQYMGKDISVAFNVRYLLEGLKTMDATDISFCLNGPLNPAVVKPVGQGDFRYLIMPVSIRD